MKKHLFIVFSITTIMMLQFQPEQLMFLQTALSKSVQPPPQIAPFLVQPVIPDKSKIAEGVNWSLSIPLYGIFCCYSFFGITCCVSAYLPINISRLCTDTSLQAIGYVVILHALTSSKVSVLCLAMLLFSSVQSVHVSPHTLDLWLVTLSLFFTMVASNKTRLLSILGSACCLAVFVLNTLHTLPPHIRVTGTICALAISCVGACIDHNSGSIRVTVRTA